MRFIEEHAADLGKGLGSLVVTAIAAITGSQEQVAWAAQVFMWCAAGVVSTLSAISIGIKLVRQWRGRKDE